jgi:hypothetical protein
MEQAHGTSRIPRTAPPGQRATSLVRTPTVAGRPSPRRGILTLRALPRDGALLMPIGRRLSWRRPILPGSRPRAAPAPHRGCAAIPRGAYAVPRHPPRAVAPRAPAFEEAFGALRSAPSRPSPCPGPWPPATGLSVPARRATPRREGSRRERLGWTHLLFVESGRDCTRSLHPGTPRPSTPSTRRTTFAPAPGRPCIQERLTA